MPVGLKFRLVRLHQRITRYELLEPESITAFMLGLKSRMSTFNVQRQINEFTGEPLMAILPGVALSELWQMMSMFENVPIDLSSGTARSGARYGCCAPGFYSGTTPGNSFTSDDGRQPLFIFLSGRNGGVDPLLVRHATRRSVPLHGTLRDR